MLSTLPATTDLIRDGGGPFSRIETVLCEECEYDAFEPEAGAAGVEWVSVRADNVERAPEKILVIVERSYREVFALVGERGEDFELEIEGELKGCHRSVVVDEERIV